MTHILVRSTRMLALPAALAALAATAGPASSDPYWGPGHTACGRVTLEGREGDTVKLYVAARGITCKTAIRIEREYWGAPRSQLKIINGGSGAAGYILLKRFAGWRCTSGAGAGSCTRGKKFAGYSYRRT